MIYAFTALFAFVRRQVFSSIWLNMEGIVHTVVEKACLRDFRLGPKQTKAVQAQKMPRRLKFS